MAYQVFDNNRPAQYPNCAVHPSWNQSRFNALEEAAHHVYRWLGTIYPGDINFLNNPYDYSGHGDTIEIREVP